MLADLESLGLLVETKKHKLQVPISQRSDAVIEPMLTVFMGALLGWIMLSVIGPIYDVIGKVKT